MQMDITLSVVRGGAAAAADVHAILGAGIRLLASGRCRLWAGDDGCAILRFDGGAIGRRAAPLLSVVDGCVGVVKWLWLVLLVQVVMVHRWRLIVDQMLVLLQMVRFVFGRSEAQRLVC